MIQPLSHSVWQFLRYFLHLSCDAAILFLHIYLREMRANVSPNKKACKRIPVTVLFIIYPNWNCLTLQENELTNYDMFIQWNKENKQLITQHIWILSTLSWVKEAIYKLCKYCMIPLIYNLFLKCKPICVIERGSEWVSFAKKFHQESYTVMKIF